MIIFFAQNHQDGYQFYHVDLKQTMNYQHSKRHLS